MVQKEVGERLAAAPGTPAYGVPSVLAQLACEVRVHRAIARTVFHPVPNVDSVLVVLRARRARRPRPRSARFVQAAFAHRRKALARLAGARRRRAGRRSASAARAALERLGHPPTPAPSAWRPRSFAALARDVGAPAGAMT